MAIEPFIFEFGPLERTAYLVQHGQPSHRERMINVIRFRLRARMAELDHSQLGHVALREAKQLIDAEFARAYEWAKDIDPDEPAWIEKRVLDYRVEICSSCGKALDPLETAWVDFDGLSLPYCSVFTGRNCQAEAIAMERETRR